VAAVHAPVAKADRVSITCERTSNARRITVALDGRFIALKGLFWLPPHMVDWEHPERGVTFVFSLDGAVLSMSRTGPQQGFMGSQVIGDDIQGKKEFVIQVTSTHPAFPVEAAKFTSLRLIASDGNTVVLDDYLDGGRAPMKDFRIPRKMLLDLLSMDIGLWPAPIQTAAGRLYLLPMKDLPNLVRPEGSVGHFAPLANFNCSILVPMQED
jgi:hypothetical protein